MEGQTCGEVVVEGLEDWEQRYSWKRIGDSTPKAGGQRLVLVHGWVGDHTAWLPTAQWLHATRGHSVLLVDLCGWGESLHATEQPLSAPLYARQVRHAIVQAGWHSFPIVLAGKSLGGATCLHYALAHAPHVHKLVLICPAGAPERNALMLPNVGSVLARVLLLRFLPRLLRRVVAFVLWVVLRWRWVRRARQHVALLTTTPSYELPHSFASDIVRHSSNGMRVVVHQGERDWLHLEPAQLLAAEAHKADLSHRVRVTFYADKGHMDLCNAAVDWHASFLPDLDWEWEHGDEGCAAAAAAAVGADSVWV